MQTEKWSLRSFRNVLYEWFSARFSFRSSWSALCLFVISFLLIVTAKPGWGAPPTLDIQPALAKYLISGRWQLLNVIVKNVAGGAAFQGEVQVTLEEPMSRRLFATYTRAVTLPRGTSETVVPVYLFLPEGIQPEIRVKLREGTDGRGKLRRESEFNKVPFRNPQGLILAVSGQPDPLNYLQGVPVGVHHSSGVLRRGHSSQYYGYRGGSGRGSGELGLSQLSTVAPLPDRSMGYDVVGLLYLGADVSPDAFTNAQVKALQTWVNGGGYLVVGRTEQSASRLLTDPRFRTWVPTMPAQNGNFKVQRVGMGAVCALGFDPEDPAFLASSNRLATWKRIAQAGVVPFSVGRSLMQGGGYGYYDFLASLMHAPGTAAVPREYIGGFLMAYILLLVPVNYLVLKLLKRREWAWGTVPLLVVLFSLGAYGFGFATKGTNLYLTTGSIVEMASGNGTALVQGGACLFSPVRSRYNVAVNTPDATLWARMGAYGGWDEEGYGPLTIAQDDQKAVARNAEVAMWGMRTFGVRTSALTLGQGIVLNLRTQSKANRWQRVVGTIENRTGKTLENVVLRKGRSGKELGTLKPGQILSIDLNRNKTGYFRPLGINPLTYRSRRPSGLKNPAPDIQQEIQADIADGVEQSLQNAASTGEPILTGWYNAPLLPLTVEGKTVSNATHAHLIIVR